MIKIVLSVSLLFTGFHVANADIAPAALPQFKCQISLNRHTFDPNVIAELGPTKAGPEVFVTVYPSTQSKNSNDHDKYVTKIKLENGLFAVMGAASFPAAIYNGNVTQKPMRRLSLSIYDQDPSIRATSGNYREPRAIYATNSQINANATYWNFEGSALLSKKPSGWGPEFKEDRIHFGAICQELAP